MIDNDGRQRILPTVPYYSLRVVDLSSAARDEIDSHIENWREELSHQVLPPDRWPLFDVRATRLPDGLTRLHFSIDMLINDATSSRILWDELGAICAVGGTVEATDLKPYEISFRDYVVTKFDRDETRQAEYDKARRTGWRSCPPCRPRRTCRWRYRPKALSALPSVGSAIPWTNRHGPTLNVEASFGLTPASLLISAFADGWRPGATIPPLRSI